MAKNPRIAARAIALVTAINNHISSNKAAFKPGSVMSEADFLSLASQIPNFNVPTYTTNFASNAEATKYNLQKLSVYTKLNKVLATRGLVIKAKNYYSQFEIVSKDQISSEVTRMEAKAVTSTMAAVNLQTGFNQYHAKFSKLKPGEIVRVAGYFNRGF